MINPAIENDLKNMSLNDVNYADYIKENYVPIEVLQEIRQEIADYKDNKIIHEERNEMIDIVLEIIDTHISAWSGKEEK